MASAATLIQPTGDLRKKILEEINEDESTKQADLAAIKDWLRKQPHLPNEWDESRLLNFLRGSNYSLEKCKKKLDLYFTMRTACPEFFSNRDVNNKEIRTIATKVQGAPLPGLTPDGRRVTVFRGLEKDINMDYLNTIFKATLMIGDVRLAEEVEGIAGDVYVLDGSMISPSHLSKISPASIKKYLICVQEAYPVKLKEIHVINTNPLVEVVFNIIKPFLKEKIKNRMFFHTTMDSLYKYIPKAMMPEEYGGYGGSLDEVHQAWIKKLESYTQWFKQQEHLKANEALRPGKPTNYDELFGISGSFRQLSID